MRKMLFLRRCCSESDVWSCSSFNQSLDDVGIMKHKTAGETLELRPRIVVKDGNKQSKRKSVLKDGVCDLLFSMSI